MLSCGSNKYLQLGREEEGDGFRFKKIPNLSNICSVACGLRHACAVDKDGKVFAWGSGTKGQLGRSLNSEKVSLPKIIPDIELVESVSCGQYFTLMKTRSGQVLGCGQNKFFEIHPDLGKSISSPVSLPVRSVETVSCGWTHVVAFSKTSCHSWGRNNYGQCGTDKFSASESISEVTSFPTTTQIVKCLAGSEHCLALDTEGCLYAWGWNEHGNCGVGTVDNLATPTRVKFQNDQQICDFFVGSAHCFAVTGY